MEPLAATSYGKRFITLHCEDYLLAFARSRFAAPDHRLCSANEAGHGIGGRFCRNGRLIMPKLKVLLACEKVIFDSDGPVSLISIFQRMNIQRSNVPLPEKAVSPTMWSVFALWEFNPTEIGHDFTQVLKVTAPDGSVFMEHEGVFKSLSADDRQVKIKTLIPGLPIWQEGPVTVISWLKGEEEASASSYKFEIRYQFVQNEGTPNEK